MNNTNSLLKIPATANGTSKFASVKPIGNASDFQQLSALAAAASVAQSGKNPKTKVRKRRRKKSKTTKEIIESVSDRFTEEKERLKALASKTATGAKELLKTSGNTIIKPNSPSNRYKETDLLLEKLEDVFEIFSEDIFRESYDYYAENLPGLAYGGPDGAPETLPIDYFNNVNTPPSEQDPAEKQARAPGQFFVGEEQQWAEAVRDLYQGMIDRVYELWQALKTALEDTKTWSFWARSWITTPLKIDNEQALALIAALQIALEKLCTGNSSQDVCRVRARKKTFENESKTRGMEIDLNELWLDHCGSTANRGSYEGSLLCDLGRNSSMARLLTRIRTTELSQLRDRRNDAVITVLNATLGALLSEKEYYEELIGDMSTIKGEKTESEQKELAELVAKRDAAAQKTEASRKTSQFGRLSAAVSTGLQGLVTKDLIAQIRDAKKLRFAGARYSLKDLDWLADKLDKIIEFGAARNAINNQLITYGVEIP